jgi:hypothetical protein
MLAMVAASCADPDPAFVDTTLADGTVTPPDSAAGPGPDYVIIDDDPNSPVSMTVGFVDNEDGLESVVFLGDKVPSDRPPEGMLFFFEGQEQPLTFTFDPQGRPLQIVEPDGAELRVLSYEQDQATLQVVDAEGRAEVVTVEVPDVDTTLIGAASASSAIWAVPAAQRIAWAASTPPATLTSTITGGYSVEVPVGLNRGDVLLRPLGCTVSFISVGSTAPSVICSTLVGTDEIMVQSTVDVAALYGGQIPPTYYETREECQASSTVTAGVGSLLLAGAFVTLVATGVGAFAIGTIAGFAGILGIGSASALVTTVAGGSLIVLAGQQCTGVFVSNEDLRNDAVQRLEGATWSTARFAPIVLRDPDRYEAVARPAELSFEPFGVAAPGRLDWITVSIIPVDETTGATTPRSIDGTYTGTLTRYPEQDLVSVALAEVTATVTGSTINGSERFTAIRSPDYGEFVEVQVEGTQWVEFAGTLGADRTFRVPGLAYSSFRIVSCQGNDSNCNNVEAPSANQEGYGVEVVGSIVNGIMTAEIIWPGNETGTYAFQASRSG